MHMIKVPGQFHEGEITSVDISPCNSLVVTGGKDGNCNVWDYKVLVEKAKLTSPSTKDFEELKPLSVLNSESDAKVNCVRFGNLVDNTDKFIASFNDGSIYKFGLLPDGDYDKILLFKHPHAIIEISWSMDDEIVALATYENEIIIYDFRFSEILEILNIHAEKSPIKGLKFDNLHGKWLCSLGDDKLINIIDYWVDWNLRSDTKKTTKRVFKHELHQKINKLITNNALNSNSRHRRLDWSQDDKVISIPNSNKGKMSLVNVLFNHNVTATDTTNLSHSFWRSWCSLIGHNFNCEVTKFNPNIFVNPNAVTNNQQPLQHELFYVIATAGSDKTLAIWNTSIEKPIIVAQDVTTSTILDICWSKDGESLMLTSLSGELVIFTFDEEELGKAKSKTLKLSEGGLQLDKRLRDWGNEYKEIEEKLARNLGQKLTTEQQDSSIENSISEKPVQLPQAVVVKNGKKRVAPMLVSGSLINTDVDTNRRPNTIASSATSMEFDAPSYLISKNISQQVKRRIEDPDEPKKKFKKELQPIEFIGSVVINPSTSFSNVRLSIPKIRKAWEHTSPTDETLYLSIKNGNGHESGPSKIQLYKKNPLSQSTEDAQRELFCDFVPKKILLSTGGEGLFWAIATIDGIVIVYSDSGKRIVPPIILGTPLSFLESKGDYLMAITCLGEIFAWNMNSKSAVFEPTSLFPLLQPLIKPTLNKPKSDDDEENENDLYENDILARAENLTLCSITSQGVPIITLSNGNGYLYDKNMSSWSLVSDSWWAFGSQYWDSTLIGASSNESKNILSMLEKHTNEEIIRKGKNQFFNKISKIMLMKEGFENLENIISINHLENKILIYKFLKDQTNFKYFLMVYVKKLIEMSFTNRIYDIILSLKEENLPGNEELVKEIVMLNPKLNDFATSV